MLGISFIRQYFKQKTMIQFYQNFITKGDLCFDIGANIGERTDCFVKLGAKVITVEPQSTCFTILTEKYRNSPQVKALQVAVGSSEREDVLMICEESNECTTLSKEFVATYTAFSGLHWTKTEKINVITLDSLCERFGMPKFCKLDVEGYESEVLLGLSKPIPYICFEFNYPMLEDTLKCLHILSSLYDYQCNFFIYEKMELVLKEWMPISDFRSRLRQIIHSNMLTGEIIVRKKEGKE